MIRRCPFKPFRPGAVIDTHPGVPEQVSGQSNVTRCDARPAGSPERLLRVHACLPEQFGQVLGPQFLSRGIHEGGEWHVDGAGEMARQRVCEGETEERYTVWV